MSPGRFSLISRSRPHSVGGGGGGGVVADIFREWGVGGGGG